MQGLLGLSNSDFLTKGQIPLVKLEVYHGDGNYIATMTFDSGSVEPQPNEILTGASTGTTATVISVTLASGAWASGTAAGTISLAFCDDRFYENENLNGSEGGSNILTVNHPDTAAGVDGFVTNGGMEVDDDWIAYGTPISVLQSSEYSVRNGSEQRRVGCDGINEGMQMDTDVYPTLIVDKSYRFSAWILWRDTNPDPPDSTSFTIGVTGDGTAELDTTSGNVSISRATETSHWFEVFFTAKCTTGGTIRLYIISTDSVYYPPVFYVDDVTIYEDLTWVDLCNLDSENYLEDWSVSLGGAKMNPNPVAGEWSAVINNQDGMFHPAHPSSFYSDLFEEGKKIRISLGATYSSVDYYWQRIIGYMEEPSYQGRSYKVNVSGFDYTKLLMDTELRKADNETYWGDSATFDSIDQGGSLGAELYAELDAMEIGGNEADTVASWSTLSNATIVSQADTNGGSTWVGKINISDEENYVRNLDVATLVAGTTYKLVFKYRRVHGTGDLVAQMRQTIGGSPLVIAYTPDSLEAETWTSVTLNFVATISGALIFEWKILSAIDTGEFRVDEISIKAVTNPLLKPPYDMPSTTKGVHRVTLDAVELFQDAQDKGWFYDSAANQFFFDEGKIIEAGSNNLVVYYYEAQTLENVVADLLVIANLYASQALALAGMNYTATGISVDTVFFKVGTTLLDAIRMCCERANYRFFFQYDGTPDFNPAPTAEVVGSEDVELHEGNYSDPNYYRDKTEIWNRVVIEGLEQSQRVSPEEVMASQLRSEESDATSIAAYGEHTKTIKNHLFQNQTTQDAMAVTLLALRKDPNYYFDHTLDFNPIPLELGDTVRTQFLLAMGIGNKYNQLIYNQGVYGGSGVVTVHRGIIRDISISRFDVQYKCEEVT